MDEIELRLRCLELAKGDFDAAQRMIAFAKGVGVAILVGCEADAMRLAGHTVKSWAALSPSERHEGRLASLRAPANLDEVEAKHVFDPAGSMIGRSATLFAQPNRPDGLVEFPVGGAPVKRDAETAPQEQAKPKVFMQGVSESIYTAENTARVKYY